MNTYTMRSVWGVYIIFLGLFACTRPTQTSVVKGDYYIGLIDFQVFNLSDSTITSLVKQDNQFRKYIRLLKENNLLHKPYIQLRQENGEVNILFLDKREYDKIQALSSNLREDKMKISIAAQARQVRNNKIPNVFEAIQLVAVDKIEGKTYWSK